MPQLPNPTMRQVNCAQGKRRLPSWMSKKQPQLPQVTGISEHRAGDEQTGLQDHTRIFNASGESQIPQIWSLLLTTRATQLLQFLPNWFEIRRGMLLKSPDMLPALSSYSLLKLKSQAQRAQGRSLRVARRAKSYVSKIEVEVRITLWSFSIPIYLQIIQKYSSKRYSSYLLITVNLYSRNPTKPV